MDPVLLYGASGYSGRLVARELLRLGLRPVLCGRDASKVAGVATELGLAYRVAAVDDPAALARALTDVAVVVNAAGPFTATAAPIAQACLARRVHYLDLTGEVPVLARLAGLHAEARARGVMIMPSIGFDVVPTDCLAAHVARRAGRGRSLALAVSRLGFLSPGSAKTLLEHFDLGVTRAGGALLPQPLASVERAFDFGSGATPCLNVSLADLVTAYFTTGIPDIATYAEATPVLRLLPFGRMVAPWLRTPAGALVGRTLSDVLWSRPPAAEAVGTMTMAIVAECEGANGRRVRSRITTPEAYAFTGVVAAAIAARVAGGEHIGGFQTPARLFGADFVLGLPGVTREDCDA